MSREDIVHSNKEMIIMAAKKKAVVEKAAEVQAEVKKAVEVKAAEVQAEVKKAVEVKAEEVKVEEVKAEAPKAEAKKAPVKKAEAPKAEAPKAEAKKAPAKKAEKKAAEVQAAVTVQFAGKSYSQADLVKIAKDVWEYDLLQKPADLKSVELYVKPEESLVYYVMNKEITGSFNI